MPQITEQQLEGYRMGVAFNEVPALDEKGNPLYNGGAGGPKLETQIMLQFVEVSTIHIHKVTVPLTPEARDELVRMLTQGLYVASVVPDAPPVDMA